MTSSQADAEFAKAAEHHRRGDLPEAERVCRRVLELAPQHFGAHYLLGVIALQRGAFEDAERSIRLALAINPNVPPAHRHHGVALVQLGRFEDALTSFTKAIALKADDAEAFGQRANALQELDRFEEAIRDYDHAVVLRPDFFPAYNNRGLALARLNRLDEALASIDRAIALKPDYAAAHKNRGDVLMALKRPAGALASYNRVIALEPKSSAALNNRGNILKDLERFDEALESYDAAIAAASNLAEAWYNRGIVLLELKRPHDALSSYDRAIALKLDYAEALVGRGLCKLAMGRFDTGWRDYENRWRVPSHPALYAPTNTPLWSGEDPRDRSILVCAERGFGDIVHFSRYVPSLAEQGARVSFLVPQKVQRILGGLPESVRLISMVADSDQFDFHCALMSLPCLLHIERADTPLSIPYLAIDAHRAADWKRRVGEGGFKIGICWQGAAWQGGASITGRALPLSAFHTLSQLEGVRLISLQKEGGLEQLASMPPGMAVETLGDDFDAGPDAFVDTIAVMEHLDLIVTCDTSIAHVAGARSRPVWIALKHVPEWRWGLEGESSPWYPTARLFRQKTRGDWAGVFAEMASELRKLTR